MKRLMAVADHMVVGSAAASTSDHDVGRGSGGGGAGAGGLAAANRAGLPTATPEQVGLSSERLGRLTAYQQALVRDGLLPCAATVVARRGRVCYWEQCGEQNPPTAGSGRPGVGGIPLAHDTIYRIYSMGKPITTVAIMILMEQGKCRLTDPLKLYLLEQECFHWHLF